MTTSKKSKSKKYEKMIYVGPNLPGSKLAQYTVFDGGYPDWIMDELTSEEYGTALKRLFVPVEKISEAQRDIRTKGKPLNKYYQIVLEKI